MKTKLSWILFILASSAVAAETTLSGWVSYNQYGDALVQRIALSGDTGTKENGVLLAQWLLANKNRRTYVYAKGEVKQGFESSVLVVDRYWVWISGTVGKNQYGDLYIDSQGSKVLLTAAQELQRYQGRRVSIWVGDFKQGYEGLYTTFKGWAR